MIVAISILIILMVGIVYVVASKLPKDAFDGNMNITQVHIHNHEQYNINDHLIRDNVPLEQKFDTRTDYSRRPGYMNWKK